MRRTVSFALIAPCLLLGGCATAYTDTAALCERDAGCSSRPMPSGQNGIQWSPVSHNRAWSFGGPSPLP